jgi:hypothetical protein
MLAAKQTKINLISLNIEINCFNRTHTEKGNPVDTERKTHNRAETGPAHEKIIFSIAKQFRTLFQIKQMIYSITSEKEN